MYFAPSTTSGLIRHKPPASAIHSALFRFDDGVCIDGPCTGAGLETVAVEVDASAWIVFRGA